MSAIQRLLARAQPGSSGGVAQHIRRGERLAELIAERWGVTRPEQWRPKYLRWALERGIGGLSPASQYHYYRTVRVIAAALGHWPDWAPHLRGPWITPGCGVTTLALTKGGRPSKLAHRGQR